MFLMKTWCYILTKIPTSECQENAHILVIGRTNERYQEYNYNTVNSWRYRSTS